jgi:hypothetical protein
LNDAQSKLEGAIKKLLSPENVTDNDNNDGENNDVDSSVPVDGDNDDIDPDDLAAAFFAQQAKKQQIEMKLPVEEWAETIVAVYERRNQQQQERHDDPTLTTTIISTNNESNDVHKDKDNLAKELLEKYRQIVSSS